MVWSEERKRWARDRIEALIWYCGDDECDCTVPAIERIQPNYRVGYPWVTRTRLWEGAFLSPTYEYTIEEREQLQYGPLREQCQRMGVAIPDGVPDPGPGTVSGK